MLVFSCTKDDNVSKTGYLMPVLSKDKAEVKAELIRISENVSEVNNNDSYTITCIPTASKNMIFSYLSYEYIFDGVNFKELNFTYKINNSLSIAQEDKDKIINYINTIILK